jgi:hypothetical protein
MGGVVKKYITNKLECDGVVKKYITNKLGGNPLGI